MAARRKGTGRKKIEIVPIEGEQKRHVCFSKRRSGLFNKVTELSALCGVEVAAIAFSPGHKAFSVGHPSVESVLGRFGPSNSLEAQAAAAVGGRAADQNPALEELIREQGDLRAKLDVDKARKDAMKEASAKARAEGCHSAAWVHTVVSQMGEEDLVVFKAGLAKMQAATGAHANQLLLEALLAGHTVPMLAGHGGGMEITPQLPEIELPIPPLTGFAAGVETVPYQTFGPHGFPQ